jgi:hypothetical protein
MSKVEDLGIAECKDDSITPKYLQQPPSCDSGRALRYRKSKLEFKGPYINKSQAIVPMSSTKSTPIQALKALSNQNIPTEWSWYSIGGNKIEKGKRNQERCGCCWAMGFVSALGDRYAIKYNIAAPYLSAMSLISCGGPKVGSKISCVQPIKLTPCPTLAKDQCSCGGSIYAAGLWLESGGSVHLEECWPFSTVTSPPYGPGYTNIAPNCPDFDSDCCADCCGNPASKPKFTVKEGSTKIIVVHNSYKVNVPATIRAIQSEIMGNGPVPTSFWEPDDFQNWWVRNSGTENIYIPKSAPTIGTNGHTIVLTGWGEENGVKYWEIRNTWGDPGYARFAMSTSTPENLWTGIDIPEFKDESWWGGAVTMLPGPLPSYNWEKGQGNKPVGPGWLPEGQGRINWELIIPIIVILLGVIAILAIINILKPPSKP